MGHIVIGFLEVVVELHNFFIALFLHIRGQIFKHGLLASLGDPDPNSSFSRMLDFTLPKSHRLILLLMARVALLAIVGRHVMGWKSDRSFMSLPLKKDTVLPSRSLLFSSPLRSLVFHSTIHFTNSYAAFLICRLLLSFFSPKQFQAQFKTIILVFHSWKLRTC